MKSLSFALAAALAFSAFVYAGPPAPATNGQILVDMHRTNLHEIKMGDLAEHHGQSDAVRQYGARLEKDHKENDKKVADVAQAAGVKLPGEDELMSTKDHEKMKSLEEKKDRAFDSAFAKAMAEGHRDAIAKLEAALPTLTGQTKQLVQNTLPTLKEHQRIAEQLAHGGTAATTNTK